MCWSLSGMVRVPWRAALQLSSLLCQLFLLPVGPPSLGLWGASRVSDRNRLMARIICNNNRHWAELFEKSGNLTTYRRLWWQSLTDNWKVGKTYIYIGKYIGISLSLRNIDRSLNFVSHFNVATCHLDIDYDLGTTTMHIKLKYSVPSIIWCN